MIRYKLPLEFKVTSIYFCLEGLHWKSIRKSPTQARSQGGGGDEGALPPAQLKQVQFPLNKNFFWCYAFFGAMP